MKGSLKTFGDVRFSVTRFQAAFYLNYSIRFQAALWIRLTLARASIRQPETYSSAIAITFSGSNLVMQSKCPSGHSRWKQGLQAKFSVEILALSLNGGVCSGLDEP